MDIAGEIAGRMLAVVLFLYIIIIVVNSIRIFMGAVDDIARYDEWKDK